MTLLNYQVHAPVSSHHEVLSKIQAFASAQAWTISEWQASKVWADQGGGVYGWSDGGENFLAIQSVGYGSQTLHFRMRSRAEGGDANHEFVDFGVNKEGETSFSTADPTHPVFQNNLKNSIDQSASFKPTNIAKLWLFGDEKHIIVVAQFDDYFIQVLAFGTVELFDSSEAEGAWCGSPQDNSAEYKWYEYGTNGEKFYLPWDKANSLLYDGALKSAGYRVNILSDHGNLLLGDYGRLTRALKSNNFSGRRVLIKPLVYVQRDIDSVFFPIGTLPIYRLHAGGLEIGQQIDFAGQGYLVFPSMIAGQRYIGFAIRIS